MTVHYYPLINKMIARLNLHDKLAFGTADRELENAFKRPFITIAREPGSGGAPIARAVAEKLGFKCIDEQIIEEIATSTKKRKDIIRGIDERSRNAIDDMVHSLLNTEYVDDFKYVSELVRVILTYAHAGHVVIIGRGANFVTPFDKGLHVNITAPYSVRLERAMRYEGHDRKTAQTVIEKHEGQRKAFVKQYFKKDINKCNAYDLTLNTSYFSLEQARDIILEAFYRKFSRQVRYGAILGR